MKRIFVVPFLALATGLLAQIILSGGAKLSTVVSGPPPAALQITSSICNTGVTGTAYSCTLTASGGIPPYSWSVLSRITARNLPPGLTLSSAGVISGTPSTAGSFTATVQVQDSASPVATATATVNIPIAAPGTCGFPTYGCGRSDWATYQLNSMSSVPPDAGVNHCTAGADGHLQACGNVYGLNTIISDPAFGPNVRIIRLTDPTSSCGFNNQLQQYSMANISGSAQSNNFDSSSNYIVISCRGTRILWFDPVTMQLRTSPANPAGYVSNQLGYQWGIPSGCTLKTAYALQGTFICFAGGSVTLYHATNGVMDGNWNCPAGNPSASTATQNCTQQAPITAPLTDLSYAVPCWNPGVLSLQSPDCGDWLANHTYPQGTNIFPSQSNDTGYCPQTDTGITPGTGTCRHSFQLVNAGSCTTGAVQPDWNSFNFGWLNPNYSGGAANQRKQYLVYTDGNCQWADMSVPVGYTGGRIAWNAGWSSDLADDVFHFAANNDTGGQDGRGACYVMTYSRLHNTFSHLNTCTGNVYNTACVGGTGYQCTGGSLSRTYAGNIYLDRAASFRPCGSYCTVTPTLPRLSGINMHAANMLKNGFWSDLGFNNCSLADAVTKAPVLCVRTNANPTNYGAAANEYLWKAGSNQMVDTWTWAGNGTIGHGTPGYNQFVFKNGTATDPNMWNYRPVDMITTGWNPLTPPNPSTINLSLPPSSGDCSPNSCWVNNQSTIVFDQHISNVAVDQTDRTPFCGTPYGSMGIGQWPQIFPWMGEVVCWALDGSNRVTRHGYGWNTTTMTDFNPAFWIGQYATDGNWFILPSDWWCTLGNKVDNSNTSNCGLPYQASHNYATVGERISPWWNATNYSLGPPPSVAAATGQVYQVTTAGVTNASTPSTCGATGAAAPPACFCLTVGCTVTLGTATFTNVGTNNQRFDLFLYKLQ